MPKTAQILKGLKRAGIALLLMMVLFLFVYLLIYKPILNNPYPESEAHQAIYYNSFAEQPKTLDPAKSYSANEYVFIGQIYEPLLEYDYLQRPYTLKPLTAAQYPEIVYLDENMQEIRSGQDKDIAYTLYRIRIKPGIRYQPHPAFAKNKEGRYVYRQLSAAGMQDIQSPIDFKQQGSRELVVDDYMYQIKRLANPAVSSPIYGLMKAYILGFEQFSEQLPAHTKGAFIDLRNYPMQGLRKIDDYQFEIILNGQYPQFVYWLAMPFFAPVPWEVEEFYAQPALSDENISLNWFPVGTGPFMMTENNPNSRIMLEKNPNFRKQFFPETGSEEDRQAGFLSQAGQLLPLIDKAVYTLEKESIPRWNKFLQGYYDSSAIGTDSFDQAIQIDDRGQPVLSQSMKEKQIHLTQTIDPSVYYMGFNMLDKRVGGSSVSARKLRQAISIAVNYDEYIAIFFNGRGSAAQGPVPPGIFGYTEGEAGINPYVYQWKNNRATRRPVEDARRLMNEAGFAGGIDPKTGRALILHYDVPASSGPESKAQLGWMRKQFAKIGISLNIRATQYNRFQEKMRTGNAQIFSWGWNADYPDPENFLFLLYGPNGKQAHGGENAANYDNPRYDQLFEKMKNMENGAPRQAIIDEMIDILRKDAPWVWGVNTKNFILTMPWLSRVKPNTIAQNTLKYVAVDVPMRNDKRQEWNQPILWPVAVLIVFLLLMILFLVLAYRNKQRFSAKRY